MFHASLIYLPVFMSGLLIYRLSDNQLIADNAAKSLKFSSCVETSVENGENVPRKKKERHMKVTPARPPVAFFSVAPLPFHPAPLYDNSP
ncbi:hypothetical protein K1719_005791 [Acacia pycnantha]|nr:hypothetical protein K1719_005791 [Acacia pycnantha]